MLLAHIVAEQEEEVGGKRSRLSIARLLPSAKSLQAVLAGLPVTGNQILRVVISRVLVEKTYLSATFWRNSSKNWGDTKERMQAGTKKSFQEMRISCNNIIHTPGKRGIGQTLSFFIAFYHLVIVAVVIVVRFW
jgi:hypothetical protein